MSSNHTFFTKLALLLIVAGALALAGCGGDDGVAQSVHDQVLADKAAADQKAADAETARLAAEEQRMKDAAAAAEAEEQRMKDAAAAEEQRMKDAAAAEEQRMKDAAAAEEQRKKDEAAAEEQRQKDAAAAEEQRKKDEAAAAEEQRLKDEAAAAEEARMKTEAANAKMLTDVQAAAMAAMDAAKKASDDAAMDAETAMDATMNIATLQTGEMSVDMAMAAEMAADDAMAAYMAAKKASDTAHADDATVETATTARDMAVAEQAKAETAAMTAMKQSEGAVKYAMSELMIDGTMKMVGESSVNALSGTLTDPADDGSKTITGLLPHTADKPTQPIREDAGKEKTASFDSTIGQAFRDDIGTATDKRYIQAVAADNITIGKTLDTTDDMARLMLIDSRAGVKMVRVYVEQAGENGAALPASTADLDPEDVSPADLRIRTNSEGLSVHAHEALGADLDITSGTTRMTPKLTSVGMYYLADDRTPGDGPDVTPNPSPTEDDNLMLESVDLVKKLVSTPDGMDYDVNEVFSYKWDADTPTDATDDKTRYVVEESRMVTGRLTTVTYRHVDTTAAAAKDNEDALTAPQQVPVRAGIPHPVKYSHLHFGVWASLGDAKKDGSQMVDDLGIGFVQNFSNSGMTATQITGKATFNGDWAAAVQAAHDAKVINLANGAAMLTADFDKDTFKGVLSGLATLEGTLSGNGFSGTKATVPANDYDLTVGGAFKGTFEGGIYGPAGEEAGGIFDFSSTTGGAFRGAFGGARAVAP